MLRRDANMELLRRKKLLYSDVIKSAIRYIEKKPNNKRHQPYMFLIMNVCLSFLPLFQHFERNERISLKTIETTLLDLVKEELTDGIDIKEELKIGKTHKVLYKSIFTIFNKILSNIIDKHLDAIESDYSENNDEYRQTFLSYSYADKGITLVLFFYFLNNDAYLYIDWMHSPAYPNGIAIKNSLSNALISSQHLLFLYTPNSEIKSGDRRNLKEWCSWEFGTFYSNHRDKYYIRCPSNYSSYGIPDILDTFKEMECVVNGTIYGSARRVMEFYIPNEQNICTVALKILIDYVKESYSEFELLSFSSRDFGYDAYNEKTKTALEFTSIIDNAFNKTVDKRFLFSGDKGLIDDKERGLFPTLQRQVLNKVNMLNARNKDALKFELVVLLPTRYSTSLTKGQEELLIHSVKQSPNNKVTKLYLLFIDSIYLLTFGKKGGIRKINYNEKDI